MSKHKRQFPIKHESARQAAIDFINEISLKDNLVVTVDKSKANKTLSQLGGIFGVWEAYVETETGMTKSEIRDEWKAKFLAKIYAKEPQNEAQELFVDMLIHLQEKGDTKGLQKFAKSISLSWATADQAREYMTDIDNYYISVDMPLPMLRRA